MFIHPWSIETWGYCTVVYSSLVSSDQIPNRSSTTAREEKVPKLQRGKREGEDERQQKFMIIVMECLGNVKVFWTPNCVGQK